MEIISKSFLKSETQTVYWEHIKYRQAALEAPLPKSCAQSLGTLKSTALVLLVSGNKVLLSRHLGTQGQLGPFVYTALETFAGAHLSSGCPLWFQA